jgi:hypothetical protein
MYSIVKINMTTNDYGHDSTGNWIMSSMVTAAHKKHCRTSVGSYISNYNHEDLSRITGSQNNQQTKGEPLSAANSLMLAGFQYSPEDWHTKDHTYGIKKSSG